MKFASFIYNGDQTYGQVKETESMVLLSDMGTELGGSLLDWIQSDQLDELKEQTEHFECNIPSSSIKFLPPVIGGEKIVCIGVNYAKRNAEYKDNSDLPKYPSVFLRYADSFVGHNDNMLRPPESDKLDYEGEIVIIIGKSGRRIKREDALDHIAGLTLMNEGTLRDWVRHAKFNVTQGKNFEKSGVIGPWMMTADEVKDYANLDIQTRVNGEVRQNDNTSNLMFPFDYIVSYLSSFMTLKPGDMISTGTPNGAGARFDPPIYLKPGDIVEVEAAGIGILKNGVEDEQC
jgi:5-carboxymethyl-2-hydroxymuconate isomerase